MCRVRTEFRKNATLTKSFYKISRYQDTILHFARCILSFFLQHWNQHRYSSPTSFIDLLNRGEREKRYYTDLDRVNIKFPKKTSAVSLKRKYQAPNSRDSRTKVTVFHCILLYPVEACDFIYRMIPSGLRHIPERSETSEILLLALN